VQELFSDFLAWQERKTGHSSDASFSCPAFFFLFSSSILPFPTFLFFFFDLLFCLLLARDLHIASFFVILLVWAFQTQKYTHKVLDFS